MKVIDTRFSLWYSDSRQQTADSRHAGGVSGGSADGGGLAKIGVMEDG